VPLDRSAMLLQATPMRNKHGKYFLEDNLFEDGLLDKMDQPEGQQYIEMSDLLDATGRCKAEYSRNGRS
jgi:hypothetical protein